MNSKMTKTKAFTLIELLVVVSIIALLVSILMPALGQAREQARAVICSTGLKTAGLTLTLYMQDNADMIPPYALGNSTFVSDALTPSSRFWVFKLMPYLVEGLDPTDKDFTREWVKSEHANVLTCPSAAPKSLEDAVQEAIGDPDDDYGGVWSSSCFGMRAWIEPTQEGKNNANVRTTSAANKPVAETGGGYYSYKKIGALRCPPSEFFLLGDSISSWSGRQWYCIYPTGVDPQGVDDFISAGVQVVHRRHSAKANLQFLDGHVERKEAKYFDDELPATQESYLFYDRTRPSIQDYEGPVWVK